MKLTHSVERSFWRCRVANDTNPRFFLTAPGVQDYQAFIAFMVQANEERWPCAGCGRQPDDKHLAVAIHKLSPRLGGSDVPDNMLALCSACYKVAMRESQETSNQYARDLTAWIAGDPPPDIPDREYAKLSQPRTPEEVRPGAKPLEGDALSAVGNLIHVVGVPLPGTTTSMPSVRDVPAEPRRKPRTQPKTPPIR